MKGIYRDSKLRLDEICERGEPAKKGMNKPVPIKKHNIKIAGIKAIMRKCVDEVIELKKALIEPKVLLLPEDDYRYIQAYLAVAKDKYGSVEDWAYYRLGVGTVVHGKHIENVEVY